ncbi:RHS repeat-associated core domain-containing protein [Pseudodesulfovibrio sp. JC047]|uniref:RHS repeat domain-containing protein n=1 Tax=Pseudodesulfovibrio sp. JC047 TaxID=2683199 RepID=UPI001EF2D07A|nr:RHS repeat-associated core domain-containing protein [Pseudodesulfovibrio sp. JC047]
MEIEDKDCVYTYHHDKNGQRKAKYLNGHLVEAYQWLDFIRLKAFQDGRMWYEFKYNDDERLPSTMVREDGALFSLYYDQIGSLRVVANQHGNVIQEILYEPFGGIMKKTNPNFRIPIGYAGGLHDQNLDFVRFGWRDYDTNTSRWTAPDPLGDKGGDPDWYGYCLDDPVNGVDPLGLFRFGKRLLSFLPKGAHWIGTNGSTADQRNYELKHEHGFFEDGSKKNLGFYKSGVQWDTENIKDFTLEAKHYDDKRMRRTIKSIDPGKYKLIKGSTGKSKNCQDYADALRHQYTLFARGDKQR